jgi:hypothetical protein
MSAATLPELATTFNSYAEYVAGLLAGRVDPAVAGQVVAIVTGLEDALKRQARDEIDIELRLTGLEETLLARLESLEQTIAGRLP